MKYFIEVIEDADELAFFKDIDGFDIAMLLDFYTKTMWLNMYVMVFQVYIQTSHQKTFKVLHNGCQ